MGNGYFFLLAVQRARFYLVSAAIVVFFRDMGAYSEEPSEAHH
jgi:hypothetical protein